MKRFETLEEICKAENIDWNTIKSAYAQLPEEDREEMLNKKALNIIIAGLNKQENGGEKWEPDYNNPDQLKHYIWWWVIADKDHSSGSGLSFIAVRYTNAFTYLGARRTFCSEPVAIHASKKFKKYFEIELLILK